MKRDEYLSKLEYSRIAMAKIEVSFAIWKENPVRALVPKYASLHCSLFFSRERKSPFPIFYEICKLFCSHSTLFLLSTLEVRIYCHGSIVWILEYINFFFLSVSRFTRYPLHSFSETISGRDFSRCSFLFGAIKANPLRTWTWRDPCRFWRPSWPIRAWSRSWPKGPGPAKACTSTGCWSRPLECRRTESLGRLSRPWGRPFLGKRENRVS